MEKRVGGGSSLTFPVTIVGGDNGELGIDLYNYLIAVLPENTMVSCPSDEYGIGEIIIQGFGNATHLRVLGTLKNILISNQIIEEEGMTFTLKSNGNYGV
jgi:hypothetical protein